MERSREHSHLQGCGGLCPLATTSSPSHWLSEMFSTQAHPDITNRSSATPDPAVTWCSLRVGGMSENGPECRFTPTGQAPTMLGAARRSIVSEKILAPASACYRGCPHLKKPATVLAITASIRTCSHHHPPRPQEDSVKCDVKSWTVGARWRTGFLEQVLGLPLGRSR